MTKNNWFSITCCCLLGAAFFCLVFGCGKKEDIVFEKKHDFQKQEWAYADSLNFTFDIADTATLYDIVLDIGHRTDFPYQNLYTQIGLNFPTGQRAQQLVNIDLADNTGKWFGEGSGDLRHYEVNIQTNAFFNQIGKHSYTLTQFMRSDILRGVESLAFKLIKKGQKQ
jgi:gliding motility-associated lipoprotein GldH